MRSRSCDIAIVGGGIIGLATAMRLTQEYPDRRVAVIEKEAEVARHQTGHNSGVIHAGIYYVPRGSQKANFCSTGGRLLREFCDARGIEYEMCGKLIVAINESEVPGLEGVASTRYRQRRRGTGDHRTRGAQRARAACRRSQGNLVPQHRNHRLHEGFGGVLHRDARERRRPYHRRRGALDLQSQRYDTLGNDGRRLLRKQCHQLRRTSRR